MTKLRHQTFLGGLDQSMMKRAKEQNRVITISDSPILEDTQFPLDENEGDVT